MVDSRFVERWTIVFFFWNFRNVFVLTQSSVNSRIKVWKKSRGLYFSGVNWEFFYCTKLENKKFEDNRHINIKVITDHIFNAELLTVSKLASLKSCFNKARPWRFLLREWPSWSFLPSTRECGRLHRAWYRKSPRVCGPWAVCRSESSSSCSVPGGCNRRPASVTQGMMSLLYEV